MIRYSITILAVILITSCISHNLFNNKLLTIYNLEDFFSQDFNNNINYLTTINLNDQQLIKSISVYQFNSEYQKYFLSDSFIFNKNGKPIVHFKPYDISQFLRSYFFYDKDGNRYLDVTIGSNNYDTIYVLRKFDKFKQIRKEISYNITRKEYGHIIITDITSVSDSLLDIKYEFYESDLKHQHILPFETKDITVKILNDSVVQTNTNRIVQFDTTSNSNYTDLYKIKNNFFIPISNESIITPGIDSDCFETRNNHCYRKRKSEFYGSNESEINYNMSISQSIIQTLYIKIDSLPGLAWAKYRRNLQENTERKEVLEAGIHIDSIELKEGFKIEDFTPKLWHIVSQDSGYINGLNQNCHIVGYNTPITNGNGFNKRCLAIYKRINGEFVLIKQSFGALEDFTDQDNNLLFDGWDETNFSVKIENGAIVTDYNYMRGEARYEFVYEKGNWILSYFESSHRTCCQAEFYSYNYKTKKYFSSITSIEEEASGDTSVNMIQERPVMYMDSINIRVFDYTETGLIAK